MTPSSPTLGYAERSGRDLLKPGEEEYVEGVARFKAK